MSASDVLPRCSSVGKAAVLEDLRGAGFLVPDFLVSPANLGLAAQQLGFPLAVRSSASLEDGGTASFAGLFRSFLGLRTLVELEDAVVRCRQSLHSAAVQDYCRRHGLDVESLRMNVIVQRMIEPDLAGVAFTVNPMTGAEEVVIEACAGLADGLLEGRLSPLPADHPLLKKHAPAIESAARKVMRRFGAPQDIEFAITDDVLYILQSRPITRIRFAPEIGEWTNADFRDGGVSSRVCSPLMWSLYDFIWDHSLKSSLRRLGLLKEDFPAGRMFFGRPYWNLGAVKNCLSLLPGFIEREFDTDLNVEINYDGDGRRTPWTIGGLVRAVPTVLAVRRFLAQQESDTRVFLDREFAAVERRYESLPDIADEAARANGQARNLFRQLIERDYFAVESCYFRTIFAVSLAKQDFKMSFPDADYAALVAALPALRHMAPVRAMQTAAIRGETDVALLVRRFRHHSRLGLDVIAPRWDEDRQFVEAMLKDVPTTNGADPGPAYQQARAQALASLRFWRRPAFNRKLDRLRTFVWLREEMRDLSSRMYYWIRRLALTIAAQEGLGDDVFFMTFQEIIDLDTTRVASNRATYDSYRNFAAPNEIGARYTHQEPRPDAGTLRGIGASPGVARGRACIARSVAEALAARAGDILVCPYTDPGWTPILGRVAGIVTEAGGLLSHAAVICREYGIPAVLGVPNALQRIRAGQAIVVDGSGGYVNVT